MDWYVVQTKPWEEERVLARLGCRGIEVFLPRVEAPRRRRGPRIEPLFPGYVFARFVLEPIPWGVVRWTPGVRRLLGSEDGPMPVPPDVVDIIRARIGDAGYIRIGIPFESGDRVRITEGPMAGLRGILDRYTSRAGRVRVLLDLLGMAVEVDWRLLEAE